MLALWPTCQIRFSTNPSYRVVYRTVAEAESDRRNAAKGFHCTSAKYFSHLVQSLATVIRASIFFQKHKVLQLLNSTRWTKEGHL
jgi:hypothetical protein